jgi:hypothetical protein
MLLEGEVEIWHGKQWIASNFGLRPYDRSELAYRIPANRLAEARPFKAPHSIGYSTWRRRNGSTSRTSPPRSAWRSWSTASISAQSIWPPRSRAVQDRGRRLPRMLGTG